MRAIGAGARGKLRPSVEEERNAARMRHRGYGLGTVNECALVGVFQAKKQGRDIADVKHGREFVSEGSRVAQRRREQIEAGAHIRPRGAEEGLVIMLVISEAECNEA